VSAAKNKPQFRSDMPNGLMVNGGVNLATPMDRIPPGQYQILRNVRSYSTGEIRTRPGVAALNGIAIPDANVHSGKQLNDSTGAFASSEAILLGAGDNLYLAPLSGGVIGSPAEIDSGYSGNPLSWNPFSPNQSPNPWVYLGDANKNVKVRIDKTVYRQGILPPNVAPTGTGGNPNPTINTFQSVTLDSGIGDAAFWTGDGSVITSVSNAAGPTDTIAAFLVESFIPGYVDIAVTTPANGIYYQPGTEILLGSETVIIDSVYPAVAHPTTIASIQYVTGTTGAATITLANVRPNLVQNSVLQFSSTGEYVLVQSVSLSKDNIPSIQVTTTHSYTAGAAITGVFSWRTACIFSHSAGATYTFSNIAGIIPSIAANTTVNGSMTRTVTIDASTIAGRPIQDTDLLNIVTYIGSNVTELQFQIVLGQAGGGFGAGVPAQYYTIIARPSDFTPLTAQAVFSSGIAVSAISLQQRKIQRDAISATPISPDLTTALLQQKLSTQLLQFQAAGQTKSAARIQARLGRITASAVVKGPVTGPIVKGPLGPGGPSAPRTGSPVFGPTPIGTPVNPTPPGAPTSTPTAIGVNQYAVLQVPISSVTRIGSDASLTWANIVQLKVQVTAQNTTASPVGTTVQFGSWWIGGTYGPSTSSGTGAGAVTLTPIMYRCAFRSSITGARSPAGPATVNGINPDNSQVQVLLPTTLDPQVDTVDIFRFGGTLTAWYYIGSGPPGSQFNDSQPDLAVLSNPLMPTNIDTPWPIFDIPRSGTCIISGAMVSAVIGTFNTNWEQGTEILVNGLSQSIYNVVSSSLLQLVNNGMLPPPSFNVAVPYSLPDPIIIGQPLPVMWGPFGTGQFGTVMFGVGSAVEPNVLFWSNPNDPDSASDTNRNELTDPSDPLMNGFVYNGRAGVFSTKKLFLLTEAYDYVSNFQYFTSDEVPNSKGLWSRWAMCATPYGIAFLASDGLYITDGSSAPTQISANLYPLFPHDGIGGVAVAGIAPVNMTLTANLRLSFIDGRLEFWYINTNGNHHTWICNGLATGTPFWESHDDYTPAMNVSFPAEGMGSHARYLCGTDGRLYQSTANPSDSNSAGTNAVINGQIRTRADDMGDSRVLKKFGDMLLDFLSNNIPVSLTLGFDLYTTLLTTALSPNPTSSLTRFPLTVIDINAGNGQISRDVTLDLVWSSSTAIAYFYEWQPSFTVKDDSTFLRATDFDNLGTMKPKFVQGIRIWADTGNVTRTIQIQGDNGPNGEMVTQSINIAPQHNGESIIAYPNANGGGWTPFIAHMVRLLPLDSASWDLLDYEWVFEEAPEAASEFATQLTTHGLADYGWCREYNIGHFSPANITLVTTYDDGTSSTYTILASGSLATYRKSYFPAATKKWKAVSYTATSTAPFRLVLKDTVVKVNGWGGGALQPVHFFGSGDALGATV
jgi:hypothetical protein